MHGIWAGLWCPEGTIVLSQNRVILDRTREGADPLHHIA